MAASASTLLRAAELTEDPDLRAERLLRAAADSQLAGDSSSALSWCKVPGESSGFMPGESADDMSQ
jgi:hypothetical protein